MSKTSKHPLVTSPYEAPLLRELENIEMGASHGVDHALAVLDFAKQLGQTYDADIDILTASVLLHDLGRTNTTLHGTASSVESTKQAKPLLSTVDFPKSKIEAVLQNIAEHDQPALRPAFLEGRILKDADFLGGFGAQGIVRSALWTGESGGTSDDFVERIDVKMGQRIRSLEFVESQQYALERYIFVKLFLDRLQNDTTALPDLSTEYIVIEGVSGSGKSTQAQLLRDHYTAHGKAAFYIHEPSELYATLKQQLKTKAPDNITKLLLLLLDRYTYTSPAIRKALQAQQPVVADRSYLSAMVYQSGPASLSPATIAYIHSVVVQPTRVIILDIEPEEAYKRIMERRAQDGKALSEHESLDQLRLHRERFKNLLEIFPNATLLSVDSLSRAKVHAKIKEILGV